MSRTASLVGRWGIAILLVLAFLLPRRLLRKRRGDAAAAGRRRVKPVLTGLLDRDGAPPAAYHGLMDAYALRVLWSDLQPRRTGPLTTRALDQALRHAGQRGAHVKLRVMAGVHAPRWAKRLGGPPMRMVNPTNGHGGTVPRFWTRPVRQGLQRPPAAAGGEVRRPGGAGGGRDLALHGLLRRAVPAPLHLGRQPRRARARRVLAEEGPGLPPVRGGRAPGLAAYPLRPGLQPGPVRHREAPGRSWTTGSPRR